MGSSRNLLLCNRKLWIYALIPRGPMVLMGRVSAVDDKMEWLHYYCHYIKFGIGRCRFDVSQEIRNNHITREEAILLCKRFEGEYPKRYIEDCFKFMNLSVKEAENIIDEFRSPHLWKKVKIIG